MANVEVWVRSEKDRTTGIKARVVGYYPADSPTKLIDNTTSNDGRFNQDIPDDYVSKELRWEVAPEVGGFLPAESRALLKKSNEFYLQAVEVPPNGPSWWERLVGWVKENRVASAVVALLLVFALLWMTGVIDLSSPTPEERVSITLVKIAPEVRGDPGLETALVNEIRVIAGIDMGDAKRIVRSVLRGETKLLVESMPKAKAQDVVQRLLELKAQAAMKAVE